VLTVSVNTKHRRKAFYVLQTIDSHCDISDVSLIIKVFPHSPLQAVFGVQFESLLVKAGQTSTESARPL